MTRLRVHRRLVATASGALAAALAALPLACRAGPPEVPAARDTTDGSIATRSRIVVDTAVRYQVMTGWEATAQAGQAEIATFATYRDALLDAAAGDLGINRLRLEVRSGAENPVDNFAEMRAGRIGGSQWRCLRYAAVNDDADPARLAPAGFHFTEMDIDVEQVVLPMRARLAARGERLVVHVNYVAFPNQCANTPYAHIDPAEYAEFVSATYRHLRDRYALVPDAWEVALEPDNGTPWTGALLGRAIALAGERLEREGFTPRFVAPSTVSMANAAPWLDAIMAAPGAARFVKELSYHRYRNVSDGALDAIAERASRHGITTGMLEHIGSGHVELYADLTRGRASSWQQFTLAYTGSDDGGKYFVVQSDGRVELGARSHYLRQYFRHVRLGAVRVGATSESTTLRPLAWVNPDGRRVVVVAADGSASLSVAGLPAGRYGLFYTTGQARGAPLADVTLARGQLLDAGIPAAGVLTIHAR